MKDVWTNYHDQSIETLAPTFISMESLGKTISSSKDSAESCLLKTAHEVKHVSDQLDQVSGAAETKARKLEFDVQLLKKILDDASLRNTETQDETEQLMDLKKESSSNLLARKDKMKSMTQDIAFRKQEIEELEKKRGSQIINIEAEIGLKKAVLSDRREKTLVLQGVCSQKMVKREDRRKYKEEMMKVIDSQKEEVQEESSKFQSLSKSMQSLNDSISVILKETEVHDKVSNDLEMLKEDVKVCQDRNSLLKREVDAFSKVKHQKEVLGYEKTNLQVRVGLLEEKNSSFNEDLKIYSKRLGESSVKSQELSSSIESLMSNLSSLENDAKSAISQGNSLKKRNSELKDDFASKEKIVDVKIAEIIITEEELSRLQSQNDEEDMLVQQFQHQNVCLSESCNLSRVENLSLHEELESSRLKCSSLSSHLDALESQKKDHLLTYEGMGIEFNSKTSKLESLTRSIGVKQVSQVDLVSLVGQLKSTIKLKKEEILVKEMRDKKKGDELKLIKDRQQKSVKDHGKNEDVKEIESMLNETEKSRADLLTVIDQLRSSEESFVKQLEEVSGKIKDSRAGKLSKAGEKSKLLQGNIEIKANVKDLMEKFEHHKKNVRIAGEGYDKVEEDISNLQLEIKKLEESVKEETNDFRDKLESMAAEVAAQCQPIEAERRKVLKEIDDCLESSKKVDVKIKTWKAVNVASKQKRLESSEMIKGFLKEVNDLKTKLDDANKENLHVVTETERLKKNSFDESPSDDEDMVPTRKIQTDPGNKKRKLSDTLDSNNDVFSLDTMTDDDKQRNSTKKGASKCLLPPATPTNSRILAPSSSVQASTRKSGLAKLLGKSRSDPPETPSPVSIPILPKSKKNQKTPKSEVKMRKQKEPSLFEDLDAIMSCSPSQ